MKTFIIGLLALCVVASCGNLADKPNNQTAFTSDQIVNIARLVEQAQARGDLSEAKGDAYISKLIFANELLGGTMSTFSQIEDCRESETKFQCIDALLSTVEGAL